MSARTRSLWTLLGAAVVALGLGAYAWFGVLKGEERETARKEQESALVQPRTGADGGTELVRFDHLVVRARGETTELQRQPDQSWLVVKPVRTSGDARAAEDVVSALQSARLKSTVEEKPTPEDLKRYGLDAPAVEVTATAGSAAPLVLRVGIENPFDASAYVRRGDDPRVHAVDASTRAALEKSTFDLRDKEVVTVRDLGLTRISLKSRKHAWTVARAPGQPFAFVAPSKEDADTVAVSGWVSGLKGQRATKFLVDSPAERKRTGVETPDVDVTFQRGDTETVRVRLAAGKKDTDPAFVLREDGTGTTLSEVPRAALAALDESAAALRDRTVLHVRVEDVARIRLVPANGGAPTVVERDRPTDGGRETWTIVAPTRGPADAFRITATLYELTALRAQVVEEPLPTDDARTGLGPAARRLVLEGVDGKTLATLVLGKAPAKSPAAVHARDDRGRVVLLEKVRVDELPSGAADVAPKPPEAPPAVAGAAPDAGP